MNTSKSTEEKIDIMATNLTQNYSHFLIALFLYKSGHSLPGKLNFGPNMFCTSSSSSFGWQNRRQKREGKARLYLLSFGWQNRRQKREGKARSDGKMIPTKVVVGGLIRQKCLLLQLM